jgi:hypothetical protein
MLGALCSVVAYLPPCIEACISHWAEDLVLQVQVEIEGVQKAGTVETDAYYVVQQYVGLLSP